MYQNTYVGKYKNDDIETLLKVLNDPVSSYVYIKTFYNDFKGGRCTLMKKEIGAVVWYDSVKT